MSNSEDVTKVLQDMKDTLFERGWCQGRYSNEQGESCLVGVMSPYKNEAWSASKLLQKAIDMDSITAWNDAPGRTFDEVIGAIDQAIVLSKEQ